MTRRTVLLCDLPAEIRVGALVGRHESSNAEGTVKSFWQPATADEPLRQGWGPSWNNACVSTGARAIYRVLTITPPSDDPDTEITQATVHGVATLECIRAEESAHARR